MMTEGHIVGSLVPLNFISNSTRGIWELMDSNEKASHPKWKKADVVIDHRGFLVGAVVVITVILATFVPGLQMDASLKSMLVTTSSAYFEYEKYLGVFGDEEFTVVAIKNDRGARDPAMLKALEVITRQLQENDKIAEVISLANLKIFREKDDKFGNFPVVQTKDGIPKLPEDQQLMVIRRALPVTDLLLSKDFKTLGLLVRIHDRWKFDADAIHQILSGIDKVVKQNVPDGSEVKLVGSVGLRQAILKYSMRTAVIFGILCTIICTVVTVYIFKSVRVTVVTMLILGVCVLWVLGLMSLMKIPLNAATSLSFGLILITSLEIVIHMVVRFNQYRQIVPDRVGAVREAVRFLARPCLISASTTAVGFGSCMVTSIPMVFQLGLIMSLGITISFCLAMILTPFIIIHLKSMDVETQDETTGDTMSRVLDRMRESIYKHHKLYTVAGFAIAVVMFAGAPLIRTDPQVMRQLSPSSPEIKDIFFVGDNLTSVHSLQLMLEAQPGDFKKPEVWKKVGEMERKLKELPEVVSTESLLPFLEYMHGQLDEKKSTQGDLFAKPGTIAQILLVTSFSSDGKRLIKEHLNDTVDKMRVSVRFKNSLSVPILDTIEQVRAAATGAMEGTAKVTVTGEPVVVAAQGDELVKSEIRSMFLAIVLITILMMIQMGTPLFGLVSLVPNIPPLATVFGMMGWLGIPLDGVTVFAATVATGLAVDNTIHYVAQLRRVIKLNPVMEVKEAVFVAYGLAAKPMASWSTVTLLGFLALLVTPFQAAVYFGLLVASAIFMGIFGDLIFMQSMILTFPQVRKLIRKLSA